MEESPRGQIEHYFGSINYNNITKVDTNRGESFTRLANKGNKSFIDYNYNAGGKNIAAGGDYTKELKQSMAYVRNNNAQNAYKSSHDSILQQLRNEWSQISKNAAEQLQQNQEDSFTKFMRKWAK